MVTTGQQQFRGKLQFLYTKLSEISLVCSFVLRNCGKTLSNKLQKLQNRAARVVTSLNYEVDSLAT